MSSYFELKPIQICNYSNDIQQIRTYLHSKKPNPGKTIRINLSKLYEFNRDLFFRIICNTETYMNMFYDCIDDIFYNQSEIVFYDTELSTNTYGTENFEQVSQIYNQNESDIEVFKYDTKGMRIYPMSNVFMYHRISRAKEKFPDKKLTEIFPGDLLREYEIVFFYDFAIMKNFIAILSNFSTETGIRKNLYCDQKIISILKNPSNFLNSQVKDEFLNDAVINLDENETSNDESKFKRHTLLPHFMFTPIRLLKSKFLGTFIFTRGIVTKIHPIVPTLTMATYICDSCGAETYQKISKNYSELKECYSEKCRILNVKPTLSMQIRASKFISTMECFMTECLSDIPSSFTPKTIKIVLKRCFVKPGDIIYVTGILDFDEMFVINVHDIYNESLTIKKDYNDLNIDDIQSNYKENIRNKGKTNSGDDLDNKEFDMNHVETSIQFSNNLKGDCALKPLNINSSFLHEEYMSKKLFNFIYPYLTDLIIESFAPEIYSLKDIKKILFLTLIGSDLKQSNLTSIRGTINTLLIGDPGTSKSQLLKTIQKITRCIYTTGAGSSGAGLTASVTKVDNDYVLEAGALVLSDMNVCCIDELDKMNIKNRTTIHETMEQQSVSISKAGINCTLNARVTLIAAANPNNGFFRKDRSLEWNLGLPVSLLSRFDCVCVIADSPDEDKDNNLAKHVTKQYLFDNSRDNNEVINRKAMKQSETEHTFESTNTEQKNDFIEKKLTLRTSNTDNSAKDKVLEELNEGKMLSYDFLRSFINLAKSIKPSLNANISQKIIMTYIEKRKEKRETTPRLLLSLLRFAIAHAKLRLSSVVELIDIEESVRLLTTLNYTYERDENIKDNNILDIYATIYKKIVDNAISKEIDFEKIYSICGFSKEETDKAIEMYVDAGALFYKGNKIIIR
ncbi:hypothetical protein EDEG_00538 [Edhazardia aedis USNM 41457]|uniref:MCM C-terminal AAA(+) ATPase domain-containing protein n=1 Tax=Edhazardia aedis (strain USNM 41457) TaxID=1003232 RepID=J8ZNI0_EDHAE|nr:hypothetical protein EDEG_00538 [Edhazardia aedis USNM 41457]|eukprot:EJW01238.1 hypothetical protein EDEG_00538 [Edhazardia aedis USNM 41457]